MQHEETVKRLTEKLTSGTRSLDLIHFCLALAIVLFLLIISSLYLSTAHLCW